MPARGRNRPDPEVWWRAEREFTQALYTGGYTAHIIWRSYPVIRHTPQGVWLKVANHGIWNGTFIDPDHPHNLKWVSNTAMKRYAYQTKEQAFVNLSRRANRYVMHCRRRLDQAHAAVQAIRNYRVKEENE